MAKKINTNSQKKQQYIVLGVALLLVIAFVVAKYNGVTIQNMFSSADQGSIKAVPKPIFKMLPSPTGTLITNGQDTTLYRFSIIGPGSTVLLKQVAFDIVWTDNIPIDNMNFSNLALYDSDTNYQVTAVIQNQSGEDITASRYLKKSDSRIYISLPDQYELNVGFNSHTYELRGKPNGFAIKRQVQPDMLSATLVGSSGKGLTGQYLNSVNSPADGKLWALLPSVKPVGSATLINVEPLIWSDGSGNPHSGYEGKASSADWINGYMLQYFPLPTNTLTTM